MIFAEQKNTQLHQKWCGWNRLFCDAHFERVPKSAKTLFFLGIETRIFQKLHGWLLSTSSQGAVFYTLWAIWFETIWFLLLASETWYNENRKKLLLLSLDLRIQTFVFPKTNIWFTPSVTNFYLRWKCNKKFSSYSLHQNPDIAKCHKKLMTNWQVSYSNCCFSKGFGFTSSVTV